MACGVAAGRLGPRLIGLGDSQHRIEHAAGVLGTRVLGNQKQDAALRRLEAGE